MIDRLCRCLPHKEDGHWKPNNQHALVVGIPNVQEESCTSKSGSEKSSGDKL